MSTTSDFLEYPIPEDGDSNGTWGVELIECLENIDAALTSHNLSRDEDSDSGLNCAYNAGILMIGSTPTAIAASSILLTDNQTNYVEVTQAGVVSANTSAFTPGNLPLYEVTTSGGAITATTDKRAYMQHNYLSMQFTSWTTKDYGAAHADWTLVSSEEQNFVISVSNADAAVNAIATPIAGKYYMISNGCGYNLTFKASGQTGVTIINGATALVRGNGTDFIRMTTDTTFSVTKSISIQDLADGSSAPTKTYLSTFKGFAYTINDDSYFSFKLPKDIDTSQDINVKVLWYINEAYATNSGEVQFQLEMSAADTGGSEAIDSGTDYSALNSGDINIPATAKYLTESTLGTFSASDLSANDLIGGLFTREALTDGNNPSGAEPVVMAIIFEYTSTEHGE